MLIFLNILSQTVGAIVGRYGTSVKLAGKNGSLVVVTRVLAKL